MTRATRISWRRLLPATALASFLLIAACETTRPDPVAPIDLRNEVETRRADATLTEMEQSKAAIEQTKVALEKFSALLSQYERSKAAIERIRGKGVSLDTEHRLMPDSSFIEAEKSQLPYKIRDAAASLIEVPEFRNASAESEMIVRDAKLRLDNSLTDAVEVIGKAQEIRVDERKLAGTLEATGESRFQDARNENKLVLYHLRDPNAVGPAPSNVVVYDSDGRELARFPSSGNALGSITLFGVESFKDRKTGDCSPLSCPLTRITLKPGFQLMSYAVWKERQK